MKFLVAGLLFVIFFSCNGHKSMEVEQPGQPLPKFTLLLTDSASRFRSADIQSGRPVVLFYMSAVCPFCHKQLEAIKANISQLKDVEFVLISKSPLLEL